MKIKAFGMIGVAVALLALIVVFPGQARGQFGVAPLGATTIPAGQLIQPADLNKLLSVKGAGRPLMLQIGSKLMFDQAHIPGSEYVGPGSNPEGLNALRERVKALPKGSFIVLYCGCCPWGRCPNVGNAFKTMRELGFTNVKVLYMADNFGTDWVSKGYPVAH